MSSECIQCLREASEWSSERDYELSCVNNRSFLAHLSSSVIFTREKSMS